MEGPIDYDTRLGISKREWAKTLGANLALLLTAYVFTLVNDGVAITVSNVALSFLRIF